MKKLFTALALLTGIAGPAAAATYDALASFNGTNGNGGFSYGYTGGTTATAFDVSATSGCALNSPTTCLYSSTSANGNLPQASFGGTYSTVNVPTDALLFHPGQSDSLSVYGGFTSGVTTAYSYSFAIQSRGTDTTTGIGYTPFTSIGGVVTLGTRGVIANYLDAVSLTGTQVVAAGQTFGIIIDRNGDYGGDSTGVNLTLTTVPEPATWALMIGGFGLVGLGMRRKVALAA